MVTKFKLVMLCRVMYTVYTLSYIRRIKYKSSRFRSRSVPNTIASPRQRFDLPTLSAAHYSAKYEDGNLTEAVDALGRFYFRARKTRFSIYILRASACRTFTTVSGRHRSSTDSAGPLAEMTTTTYPPMLASRSHRRCRPRNVLWLHPVT